MKTNDTFARKTTTSSSVILPMTKFGRTVVPITTGVARNFHPGLK